MADEWYYARGKEKVGPLTMDQLKQLVRSGELARNGMVWKEGMAKWNQAAQVEGLFDAAPPPLRASLPPPLPDEDAGAVDGQPVRPPDELKFPVIGMFVVSGMALFLGVIGVLDAGKPVVRILMAVGVAHNIAAVFLTTNIARLRNYGPASLAPWVVMTCWAWYWFTNPTHGVTLLGMVLAISSGVWAFLAMRGDGVRRAFDADPPQPPLFFAGKKMANHDLALDPGTRFPWPARERTASNPKIRWVKIGIGASIVVGVGFLLSVVGAIMCLPFFSLAILIYITALRTGRLHGRWVPLEGGEGWVEFASGGVYKREDGTVGTFAVLSNQKFIDILVSGHLVDSWKMLSWEMTTLEVQDMAGRARSFKKGKTLAEKQAATFFQTDRGNLLQRKWEPVNGDGPAIQFTEDGAMIRFDGFAARFTLAGEEPNEVVVIHIDDTQKIQLKVLSLNRDEMVLAGEGGTCHYRRAVSITDAESQRRAEAAKEKLKAVGKAALLTVGAIGAGIAVLGVAAAAAGQTTCNRCGFTRVGLHSNCPNCGL